MTVYLFALLLNQTNSNNSHSLTFSSCKFIDNKKLKSVFFAC